MEIKIIDKKNWNVVQAISDRNKKYYENIDYPMNTVDNRLKIKIKNIDRLNQKVFIEFMYDNRKEEKEDFREDYIYEIDVNQDVSYGLKINSIFEENNTKFVKFECGILDKFRKEK